MIAYVAVARLSSSAVARVMSIYPSNRLFFYIRKGYKLAFFKGRYYGQEEEKAALVDFRRSP